MQSLDPALRATVVTHSPTIAVALVDHPGIEVLVIGGRLFKHSVVTCGALAVEATAGIHADACFIGVTGVHAEAGLTTGDADEAAMKRALGGVPPRRTSWRRPRRSVTVSPHRVLEWADVTAVLTDAGADDRRVDDLRRAGVDVRVAPAATSGR